MGLHRFDCRAIRSCVGFCSRDLLDNKEYIRRIMKPEKILFIGFLTLVGTITLIAILRAYGG